MKKLCIYHGNCSDGFTAAWAVWRALPDTQFHAGVYGEAPPNCFGRDVIMVDFSYKRDVIVEMAKSAKSILILDHHTSAEGELVDLPINVEAIFDMDRSGAMITWQHYHNDSAGQLVQHVQDRDLWRFEIENTQEFNAYLSNLNQSFEVWNAVNNECENPDEYARIISIGSALHKNHQKTVLDLVDKLTFIGSFAGMSVPILNVPHVFASDAGNIIARYAPFAVCHCSNADGVQYSLRSDKNGMDVALIAQKFGGGGHKHAAGFSLKYNELDKIHKIHA